MLMGICLRYMKRKDRAEDVLQETYIHAFQKIEQFEGHGSLAGWLSRIAVTKSLKELRKRNPDLIELEPHHSARSIQQAAPIIEEMLAEDILDILNEIPEHYRVIFNLAIIEGYSHAEIAELLQIKESNSRARLTRARARVKEIFIKKNEVTHEEAGVRKVYPK